MNRLGLVVAVVAVAVTQGQRVFGTPSSGANCASCHTGARGTVTITGAGANANPTEACGSADRGSRPVFTVTPGTTKTLTATLSGIASGATYAGVIKGFDATGVEHCGPLSYTGDSAWTYRGATSVPYYTRSSPGTSLSFAITVPSNATADYYDLVFATAGLDSTGRFYAESHFYVQVAAPAATTPSITLNKTSLTASATQGASPAGTTFTVANGGTGTLNYTIADSATWLSVSPTSGTSTGTATSHTVTYNTTSLAAGTYSATITVTDANATNSPKTINVSLTITAAPKPTISLNKTTLSPTATAGASPPNDTFTVANSGSGTLNYTIADSATWLSVSPTSGTSTGAATTHTVAYSTTSLAAGTYSATITVTDANATNSPQTINVSLTITAAPKPTISLNKTTLSPTATAGASPANETFTVANSGSGTLNYTIADSATWLTVSPTSGTSTGTATSHTVTYNTTSLAAGTYSATITVTDANATNSPKTISVSLTITAASGGGDAAAGQTLYGQRCSGCHPSPTALAPAASRITTDLGTVNAAMNGITLTTQQVADLQAYLGSLSGSTPTPTISLNKASLTASATQGASPASTTFTVANGGTGTLNYAITDSATWLSVSPTSGTSTGAATTHTVTYNTTSLAAGTYSATITVTDANATNSPQTINVSLTITAVGSGGGDAAAGQTLYGQRCSGCHPSPAVLAPAANRITTDLGTVNAAMNGITLTTQQVADLQAYLGSLTGGATSIVLNKTALSPSIAAGSSPPSDTFTVGNGGTGTLNYAITDSATWLSVSPASGSSTGAANTHTVTYSTASMTAGTYSATITVTDANASNSPQTITVSLTITNGTPVGSAAAGQTLYGQMCSSCHPSAAVIAPAASRITTNMGAVNAAMNSITLTSQQVADLQAYLASLSGGPPSIVLSKTALSPSAAVGASPADDTFAVANGGQGTVNYTVTSSVTWLTIAPTSGASTGPANTHTVTYDTATLAAGTYPATITVTSADAANSPQTVNVTLTITSGAPVGDVAAGQTLYGEKCSTCHPSAAVIAPAKNRITTDMGSVSPAMGSITLTPQQVADLQAYLTSLTGGSASIVLDKTTLSPSVAAGTSPANDTFTVANGGQGTLAYTITTDAAWLAVSPADGTSAGPANTHTVTYNTALLAAGTYSATISVADANAANSPQTIAVSLTVTAAPPGRPGPGDGDDGSSEGGGGVPPPFGFCGAGAFGMVPAMLLGLAGLRLNLLRRRNDEIDDTGRS